MAFGRSNRQSQGVTSSDPQRPYLGQTAMTAALLPARAAYLIRDGSELDLRRAIQQACTRWGGACEPIVPVKAGGDFDDWYRQVVGVSRPSGLVNVGISEGEARAVAATLSLPLVPLAWIDHGGPVVATCHPSALPSDGRASYIASQNSELWEVAAAGDLAEDQLASLSSGGVVVSRSPTPDQTGRMQVAGGSLWIHSTLNFFGELHQIGGTSSYPTVIWVAGGDQVEDAVYFWNLRVLRPLQRGDMPLMILPADDVHHWVEFDAVVRSRLNRAGRFSPDVVIGSVAVERERLDQIAQEYLGLVLIRPRLIVGGGWPKPSHDEPFTYTTEDRLRAAGTPFQTHLAFQRSYGMGVDVDVQMFPTETTIRFESPVPFQAPGRTLLSISGDRLASYPQRATIAKLIHEFADWCDGSLQLETFTQERYLLQVNLPSLASVTEALLAESTTQWRLSTKGAIGAALQTDTDISALLEPGVVEAIKGLTTPRRAHLIKALAAAGITDLSEEATGVIADWAIRADRIHRSAVNISGLTKPTRIAAVERLCALGWAERGFEIKCTRCGTTSFMLMSRVTERGQPTCPACKNAQHYTHTTESLITSYRLDGVVDLAADQGVIPHLLIVAGLLKRQPDSWFLPGIDIWFPGLGSETEIHREVDIFGILGGRVLSGEVKTQAAQFTTSQIQRDIEVSVRLGADIHLAAATDKIPEDVRTIMQGLCDSSNIELMMIDAANVRPLAS